MTTRQELVVAEKKELDARRQALQSWISAPENQARISDEEERRLHRQAAAMYAYSMVLGERIDAFTNDEEE
jgi:hypothetical protein